jgi:hypothetical protein
MNYVSKLVSNVTSSVSPRLSLKRSRYGANRISDAGVYELSAALIHVSSVELLELPYNIVTDQGASAIYDEVGTVVLSGEWLLRRSYVREHLLWRELSLKARISYPGPILQEARKSPPEAPQRYWRTRRLGRKRGKRRRSQPKR